MRIKTFYTKTMSEALQEIKTHLGSEALLLSTKEVPLRSGIWGRSSGFEVVAAVDYEDDIDVYQPGSENRAEGSECVSRESVSDATASAGPIPESYFPATIIEKKPSYPKKNVRPKKTPSSDPSRAAASRPSEKELPFKGRIPVRLYQDLVNRGVHASLARTLLSNALDLLGADQPRGRAALLRAATQAACSLIAPPSAQNGIPGKKVVVFVGPTGAGKTTSAAKLAARLALQEKKKVVLVTLDCHRIGAVEQLRSYAGIMGIPFRFVDRESELSRVIEDNSQKDYILVDTAGRGPRDMESMLGLAVFLRKSEFIERHLVLSATTRTVDMRRIMDQFETCRPDHLLFTKLDETSTPGPILNELVRTQKAFSYYTDGQRIPDDLHAVPREQIMDLILNPHALEE
jgi:flagellar biosynthesis protein FlhF